MIRSCARPVPCGPSTLTRSITTPPCRYHSPQPHDWSTLPPSVLTAASHGRRSATLDRCQPCAVPPGDRNPLISLPTPVVHSRARSSSRGAAHLLVRRARKTRSSGNPSNLFDVKECVHADYLTIHYRADLGAVSRPSDKVAIPSLRKVGPS